MRGKILSCMLLAIMLGSVMLMATASAGESTTQIRVEPDLISNPDFHIAIGQTFSVDIMISRAENLYAWGLYLGYSPIRMVLDCVGASGQTEFLGKTGYGVSAPAPIINSAAGTVYISATIMGAVPGVSGDGKLCTVTFKVMEAGECALHLYDTKLLTPVPNPTPPPPTILENMPHMVKDGYYLGPKAELVRKELPLGRDLSLASRNYQTFLSSVKSVADVPLYVKTKFHMIREDGKVVDLWSTTRNLKVDGFDGTKGHWDESGATPFLNAVGDGSYITAQEPIVDLYADGFDGTRAHWTEYGKSPFLNATNDGSYITATYVDLRYCYVDSFNGVKGHWNESGASPFLNATGGGYIYTTTPGKVTGEFGFADTPTLPTGTFVRTGIEFYCKGDGDDSLIYNVWNGTKWVYKAGAEPFVTPPTSLGWVTMYEPALDTRTKINAAKIYIWYSPVYEAAKMTVDAARLKVYVCKTSTTYTTGEFSFENTAAVLPDRSPIVNIEFYCQGDGDDRLRYFVYDGATWNTTSAFVTPPASMGWVSKFVPDLNNATKINGAKIYIYYEARNLPAPMTVDAVRLKVYPRRSTGVFSFADTTISPERTIKSVSLEFFGKGDGTDIIEVSLYDGTQWTTIYPTYPMIRPISIQPENLLIWNTYDVTPILTDETKINAAKMWMYYRPGGLAGSEMFIDAARLSVTLSPQIVQPGKVLEMEPIEWSDLITVDAGTYTCEAECYYSYTGVWFNKGLKTSTFRWWIAQ